MTYEHKAFEGMVAEEVQGAMHEGSLPAAPEVYALGNAELPIAKHRADIEKAIQENSVVVLMAPTGSGKTTQVPQYAREMSVRGRPVFDDIIVTQPRIVAARTVSERVAEEVSHDDMHHAVGYYTSKEGTASRQKDQHIAFLTDGKAMTQLLHGTSNASPNAKKLLIIDEVHEWNLNIEMLVAIAAARTNPRSPDYDKNLKVVIMSATMDGERLQKYFAHCKPPLISVKVPTYNVVRSISERSVAEVALQLARDTGAKVLAFHPGKREIAATEAAINKQQAGVAEDERVVVVPLHGQLTAEEQRKAFEAYPNGSVVATTNAAETSLTVPDAVAVVDGGEVRVDRMRYDLITSGTKGLYLENAPQANLDQRAGRVGRTQDGVYVACTQDGDMFPVPYEDRPAYATPSIQRSALDGLLLHLKATGHEFSDFKFFHEVPDVAAKAAAYRLYNLGAIDEHGTITERGLQMERLPLDPEFACMVVFAYENDYSADVKRNILDIAAIMQRGGVLGRAPKEQKWRDLLVKNRRGEVVEADGDYFAQLEAYIELSQHVDIEDWIDYDVNEHAASLVEQDRESLARVLGVSVHKPRVVAPSNRRAVLTCIHAGQINQIWRRSGEMWSLLIGPRAEYELTASSVVQNVGELVTGSLFSLGIGEKTYNTVQDVHAVQGYETLAIAAKHLVKRVYAKDTAVYDAERKALVVAVEHKLGPLVLRTTYEELDAGSDEASLDAVRQGYLDHAWNTWDERKDQRPTLTAETIDAAIEQPEAKQYGTDPVTGEPLLAWKGGKGQWVRSRDVAVESLKAHKAQLQKQPRKQEQREIKAEVRAMRAKLVAANKRADRATTDRIRAILGSVTNTREWLEEATLFFEPASVQD